LIETPSKFIINSPKSWKWQLPSSRKMAPRCRAARAKGRNCRILDGREIAKSDEQPTNAILSIHQSLEPVSNVIVERNVVLRKESRQRRSTEQGIQIDESDEQL
jgi:hypothetical protein